MMTTSSIFGGSVVLDTPKRQKAKALHSGLDVNIKKIHKDAKEPVYSTEHAGAFDLFTIDEGIVAKDFSVVFRTGLQIEIPDGHVMLLFSRSGHGFNLDVRLSNCVGVIDADYRGEIKIKLVQDLIKDEKYLEVQKGDRIAQGIILPYPKIQFNVTGKLSETLRGENGLGSTGK